MIMIMVMVVIVVMITITIMIKITIIITITIMMMIIIIIIIIMIIIITTTIIIIIITITIMIITRVTKLRTTVINVIYRSPTPLTILVRPLPVHAPNNPGVDKNSLQLCHRRPAPGRHLLPLVVKNGIINDTSTLIAARQYSCQA